MMAPRRAPPCRHQRIGQAGQRDDVEVNHGVHLRHVAVQQWGMGADAGVIHQQRNARVLTQLFFQRVQLCGIGESAVMTSTLRPLSVVMCSASWFRRL